ncbi:MAG: methyltransferase domain-containing protein [Planctomycetota bacterium]
MLRRASLRQRNRQPEWMDEPNLDRELHENALRGLARINSLSFAATALWREIANVARAGVDRPLRILDVATGSGDVPIRLQALAANAGVAVELSGCDISTTAIDVARTQARSARADVDFFAANPVQTPISQRYDVVMASLFLHHLDEEAAVTLLRHMRDAATSAVFVSDLRRSTPGYWLARIATQALTRSPVVHVDGPRSVEAAFTIDEAQKLAAAAGWTSATVRPIFPCRFLLSWRSKR